MDSYGSCLQSCPLQHDFQGSSSQWLGGDLRFLSVLSSSVRSDEGTFALCSSQLGKTLGLQFFNVVACIVTVCVILLWTLVASRTAIEGWKGEIFYAPCLASVGDRIPEPIDMTAVPANGTQSS